jgi:hypothetical protein
VDDQDDETQDGIVDKDVEFQNDDDNDEEVDDDDIDVQDNVSKCVGRL